MAAPPEASAKKRSRRRWSRVIVCTLSRLLSGSHLTRATYSCSAGISIQLVSPALGAHDAHAHERILRPGLRVALGDQLGIRILEGDEVREADRRLVGLQVRDRLRVVRPPVADVTPAEDLLPVDPRERPVERRLRAIVRQPRLRAAAQLQHVQVVVP